MHYGFGINDYDGTVFENGKPIKSYNCWRGMLERCFSFSKKYSTYHDTTVCEEWKLFSNFKRWYDENYVEGYVMDKDLSGGKIYSPETCIFIPQEINKFMTNKKSTNVTGCAGVYVYKGDRFRVQINDFKTNKRIGLGIFNTIEDAKTAYKNERRKQSEVAMDYMRSIGIYNEDVINKIK